MFVHYWILTVYQNQDRHYGIRQQNYVEWDGTIEDQAYSTATDHQPCIVLPHFSLRARQSIRGGESCTGMRHSCVLNRLFMFACFQHISYVFLNSVLFYIINQRHTGSIIHSSHQSGRFDNTSPNDATRYINNYSWTYAWWIRYGTFLL